MGALDLPLAMMNYGWHRRLSYQHKEVLRCKYCGKTNVYWKELKYGWRLIEMGSNKVHLCLRDNYV